jgi:hypothetical protein
VLSIVWHYIETVLQQWYTLVTGGLFVLDQFLQWIWPPGKRWLDSRWPAAQRRPAEVSLLVVLFCVAAFDAYRDEYTAHAKAEARSAEVERQLAGVQGELKALREHPPTAPSASLQRAQPRRLINYGGMGVDTASMGDSALEIKEIYFDIKNVGDDPLHLRFVSGAVTIDGKRELTCAPQDAKYLGKGEPVRVSCKPKSPERGLVSIDSVSGQLRTRVEYDTIPPSSIRTSIRVSSFPIDTPKRGQGGFGFEAPKLIESIER